MILINCAMTLAILFHLVDYVFKTAGFKAELEAKLQKLKLLNFATHTNVKNYPISCLLLVNIIALHLPSKCQTLSYRTLQSVLWKIGKNIQSCDDLDLGQTMPNTMPKTFFNTMFCTISELCQSMLELSCLYTDRHTDINAEHTERHAEVLYSHDSCNDDITTTTMKQKSM